MSTSSLYHAFGIRGYDYVRTDYRGGRVIFTIAQDPEDRRCSACSSREVISRGHAERRFRTVPIGSRPTAVVLPIPRVECRACDAVRQVEVPFADPRRSYTRSFERYVLELSRRMTIRDVAHHLDVGWDLVKDIQKRDLSRRYAKPKLKHLRSLAIDEIAVAKGHRYLTVIVGLRRQEDSDHEVITLVPFLEVMCSGTGPYSTIAATALAWPGSGCRRDQEKSGSGSRSGTWSGAD